MDYDDQLAEADNDRFDNAQEAAHRRGDHNNEPSDDCWVCQASHGA